MAKRSVAILVTLGAIVFVVVYFVKVHYPRARSHPESSLHASNRTPVKLKKGEAAPVRSGAKPVARLAYSEKEYAFLRRHYKSPMPQARGALPESGLKLLGRVIGRGVMAGRKLLPVVKEVIHGRTSALENRLDTGLSPNSTVLMGYPYHSHVSLLDIAIRAGQRGVIKVLLAHDASVNPPDQVSSNGESYGFEGPLAVAAEYGEDDVVRQLLQRGANVNQRHGVQTDNESALGEAVYHGNVSTAYLLLTHGANIGSVLGRGGTVPVFLYKYYPGPRRVALRHLLIKYGGKMPET